MSVLVALNEATDPLGLLAPALEAERLDTTVWRAKHEPPPADLRRFSAVIALGGATNPDQDADHPWLATERSVLRWAVQHLVPVLAVCLGAQLLAQASGGITYRRARLDVGWRRLTAHEAAHHDPLAPGWAGLGSVLEWHRYGFTLPAGGTLLAGASEAVEAFRCGPCAWGFQYHVEASVRLAEAWAFSYPADLREAGVDPTGLALQGEQHGADAEAHGTAIARAFATFVAARSAAEVTR